jgi:hypothetical protein
MLDSRTRVRGLVLAAVCAAALGLAACGDDDDDAATTDAPDVEATETTGDETTAEETTSDDSGETTDAASGDVTDQLRAQLEASGISSNQVDCVVDELESTLGEETLEELQTQTTPSEEVIDASTAAAQKCLKP